MVPALLPFPFRFVYGRGVKKRDGSPFPYSVELSVLPREGNRPARIYGTPRSWSEVDGLPRPPKGADLLRVAVRFGEVDGRLECVGVEVVSDSGLPASTLSRGVPYGAVIAKALATYRREAEALSFHPAVSRDTRHRLQRSASAAEEAARGKGKPGRPLDKTDDELLKVAQLYAQEWQAGRSDPTQVIANERGISRTAAAKWVYVARRRGLLTRTSKGKPGGRLTAKARRLLEDSESETKKSTRARRKR
jgi:hypothetical protein